MADQNEPLPADLRAFLGEFPGAANAPDTRFQSLLTSARAAFEFDTNLRPLLAAPGATATAKPLRARNGMVNFGGPLCQIAGVTLNGLALEDIGIGFSLLPENEPVSSYLKLDIVYSSYPGAVVVTGVWGAFLVLPEDIKEALLCRAALLFVATAGLSPTLAGLISGPGTLKRRQDEDIQEEVVTGEGGGGALVLAERMRTVGAWKATYSEAVKRRRFL